MTDLTERLWASDAASALTNVAAREIERLTALAEQQAADLRTLAPLISRHQKKRGDKWVLVYCDDPAIDAAVREAIVRATRA